VLGKIGSNPIIWLRETKNKDSYIYFKANFVYSDSELLYIYIYITSRYQSKSKKKYELLKIFLAFNSGDSSERNWTTMPWLNKKEHILEFTRHMLASSSL